jgi:hypothetical protein
MCQEEHSFWSPVEDFLRTELSKTSSFPARQDMVVEPGAVLLPRGRRQFDLRIVHVVVTPHLGRARLRHSLIQPPGSAIIFVFSPTNLGCQPLF